MLSIRLSIVGVVIAGLAIACGGRVSGGSSSEYGGASGADAGAEPADPGTCNGSTIEYCDSSGKLGSSCCPANAHCSPPASYCRLGGDACIVTTTPCNELDAGTIPTPPPCASIDATSYDQSCTSDTDCVAVYSGSACSQCYCANAAINKSATMQYSSDWSADNPKAESCDCFTAGMPKCSDQGVCVLK